MNDGQYTNIRNYVEEIASQLKQVLAEQKRTNELLEKTGVSFREDLRKLSDQYDAVMEGKPVKVVEGKTKGATSEFVEGTEKPAVPRRQNAPVEGLAAMETMTAPVTVETVKEAPLKTVETVEIQEASKGPKPASPHGMGGKTAAKKGK